MNHNNSRTLSPTCIKCWPCTPEGVKQSVIQFWKHWLSKCSIQVPHILTVHTYIFINNINNKNTIYCLLSYLIINSILPYEQHILQCNNYSRREYSTSKGVNAKTVLSAILLNSKLNSFAKFSKKLIMKVEIALPTFCRKTNQQ